jgi:hypothetical protein
MRKVACLICDQGYMIVKHQFPSPRQQKSFEDTRKQEGENKSQWPDFLCATKSYKKGRKISTDLVEDEYE